MATLKESYVASCMEIQSLKSAKKTSKGPKPRNVRGVSRMRNLDGEGFETPVNHVDLEDADDSEKEDADGGENDGADPSKEPVQGRLDDPIQQRLQQLEDMIARIPGVPRPMEKATPNSYADSPFADPIALIEVPKRFSVPSMKLYDGTADPNDHVAQYKQRMITILIPKNMREACMCKGFGSTLTGPALQWFINLNNGTISSFAQLVNAFNMQFASSRKMEKQASDLHRIMQKSDESLKEFVNRFNREKVSIPNCDARTAIEAFRRGLDEESDLYKELTKYPCPTFEDAQAKALAQIRLEEDMQSRKAYANADSRKAASNKQASWRQKPYERSQQGGIINTLHSLGSAVKWPFRNEKSTTHRDKSKWCEFHGDHGHHTDECVALRREVSHLLKQGYLKDLLTEKGKQTVSKNDDRRQPPSSPPHVKVINVISGGSDICGLTYSAAKRHARDGLKDWLTEKSKQTVSKNDDRRQPPSSPPHVKVINVISGGSDICGLTYSAAKRHARDGLNQDAVPKELRHPRDVELEAMPITFDNADLGDDRDIHHDDLVISLTVSNCLLKRVLMDNGSSANILMRGALEDMGIDERDVIRKSTVLVGFSRESKHTMGEVTLPTFAKGVNMPTKFYVIDCPSSYNVILGRPWIHSMKVVPSLFHQSLKFPTKWGVQEIKGDRRIAKECYKTSLKPRKSEA
ncbi:uncharacterized protein LOC104908818 [Beta vulgaris subsp. vulgaris]|uniref:uncharacterized protein LOC104908818 n=1 Tax=Beta vulgaris subsp. vulgaris TaxID=3555 RepID=UPI002549B56A|nr:uncharacterized protein LOC104908818 [Beta vulgaris subsp. vulgaris]